MPEHALKNVLFTIVYTFTYIHINLQHALDMGFACWIFLKPCHIMVLGVVMSLKHKHDGRYHDCKLS